jgi:translation initiation factor IF-3
MAQERGLDLVEVSPNVRPPVCRIMDFGKFKYEQKKKMRKAKAATHETQLKGVTIRTPKIGVHDLMIKVNHAREFLERGDRVQFALRFRGRELAHIDEGKKIFEKIKSELEDCSKVTQNYRFEARRLSMILAPLKKN